MIASAMNLSGNTVLITGGSSGIGYAMAEAFLAAESTVIVCARGEERLREAQLAHPNLHVQVCDVADPTNREELVTWVTTQFPALNVLVNNAGVQRDIDFSNGLGEFLAGENEIRVNLEAPIILTGLLVPHLAKNANPVVINVSSGLAFHPMAEMPVYCASKAGMHVYSVTLQAQLARIGMKVFEIVPPMVDTSLNPEGRAKRGGAKAGLSAKDFVAEVMRNLEHDKPTIGYGINTLSARKRPAKAASLLELFSASDATSRISPI